MLLLLRAQGVSGEDLLNTRDAEEFCRDLKAAPFVARQVLSLRDHARCDIHASFAWAVRVASREAEARTG